MEALINRPGPGQGMLYIDSPVNSTTIHLVPATRPFVWTAGTDPYELSLNIPGAREWLARLRCRDWRRAAFVYVDTDESGNFEIALALKQFENRVEIWREAEFGGPQAGFGSDEWVGFLWEHIDQLYFYPPKEG